MTNNEMNVTKTTTGTEHPFGGYYHPATRTVFNTEECEKCGDPALAPNSVTIPEPTGFALKFVAALPEELGWDEAFEGCTCGC